MHDTFLVMVRSWHPTLSSDFIPEPRFILQRLNTRVFPRPEPVMANLRTCTEHVRQRLARAPLSPGRRWEAPRVLPASDGRDYWVDPHGSFWRAFSFIGGAETFDTIADRGQAQEVGGALGMFHNLLSDLPPQRLADTLPGFHITPDYLRHFDEVLAGHLPPPSPEARHCLSFISKRRAFAPVLEEAKARGRLRPRPIHGDPKVNNVMLDTATGQAVAMIDLDTVKPGLVHYDIGDCLRSGANPMGEESEGWEQVYFEPGLGRAMLTGYLAMAGDFLGDADYDYLFAAVRLIAFELGLRFFTDYLEGNVYFKARHRDHNLARALVQFRLTESIEAQESAIRAIIRELRG